MNTRRFLKRRYHAPADPVFQHLLDTYASETNKVVSLWRQFGPEDMAFKPAEKSSTVLEIMKHQLLSERRFFAEFIGLGGEPEAAALIAARSHAGRFLAAQPGAVRAPAG